MGDAQQTDLSPYERMAILRDETDRCQKELTSLIRQISVIRDSIARRKYLWSLSPEYYKEMPPPEGAKELPELEKRRILLVSVVQRLTQESSAIDAILQNQPSPQPQPAAPNPPAGRQQAPAAPKKTRFASFDDFASQNPRNRRTQ
ncbi:MAG: hypothetical protein JW909_06515 [Planctomycetes bacterium]|nr:hypothetical protein [Planctomycetota bacterium]